MYYILLAGVFLNYLGALGLLKEIIISPPKSSDPEEYFQLKLFVIGVATTFGSIYLYLFFNNDLIFPFLIFGASLKIWAFATSLYLYATQRIKVKLFFEFGILNGVIAVMFMALLVHHG
ncbi:MAG: hypothetical protein K6L75_02885 [Cellvibrionaceae bacterium]